MPRRHHNAKSAKQRKDQQSKFIMAGLCAGLLMLLAVVWSLGSSDDQVNIFICYKKVIDILIDWSELFKHDAIFAVVKLAMLLTFEDETRV